VRLAFLSSTRAIARSTVVVTYAMVAASPSSSVSAAGPTTNCSKCSVAASSSLTPSTGLAAKSRFNRSASGSPWLRPDASSPGTTSTTARRLGKAAMTFPAQPDAFRLMTVLVSATRSALGSVTQVRDDRIKLTPFNLLSVEDLAQFHAIEAKEVGKLPLTQESTPIHFCCEQTEPQRSGAVYSRLVYVRCGEISQNQTRLFICDPSIRLKPVPRAGLNEDQFLKAANDGFAGHAEEMSQDNHMTARQPARTCGHFLEFLHYGACRSQEGPAKCVGVALLTRILKFVLMQNVGLLAG